MPRTHTVKLRKDLTRTLRAGHPWVYRDALQPFDAAPGDILTVRDPRGRFVGRGIADAGAIGVRLWTTVDEPLDRAFVERRVREAVALRRRLTPPETNAIRLLHGEGDRLGGVVCDRYGNVGVLRLDGAGTAPWQQMLVETLVEAAELDAVLVKRGRRGSTRVDAAHGEVGSKPREVIEYGMRMLVDVWRGQKTGLFLDHRESRYAVRGLAEGLRVLNLYGYTGGFSVAAGLGGARAVETVDVAAGALDFADRGWSLNELSAGAHTSVRADVPKYLQAVCDEGRKWDLVVCDPPSFAPKRDAKRAALKAYRALHRSCLRVVEDGGLLLIASCSSHIDADAFEQTLRDASEKTKRVVQVLGRWGAAPDHPRLLAFPEGDYLKVVLCRVSR